MSVYSEHKSWSEGGSV